MQVGQQAARHQKRWAKGVISCPDCKYSILNQQEMKYQMATNHAQPSSKHSTVCSPCEQEFPSYYSLQQNWRKEHGAKQRKPSDTLADFNNIEKKEGEDGEKLKEELSACQLFLVGTEMKNGGHKAFNFQVSKLDTKIFNEKLEEVLNKLNSAAKINIDLVFVLRNIDIKERQKTRWLFKLITTNTVFAALLKNIPMGCPDSVLPEPLLRHTQVNCLLSNKDIEPYIYHLCLFRAMARYMNGHLDLDSHTCRYFTEFITKSGYDPKSFHGVSVEDIPVVEEIVQRNIFM